MKIAFIGQKGIPSISGGVEKHVEDLSVKLVASGHEVIVYTRSNYTPRDKKVYLGVRLISLPTVRTKHLDAIAHTFFAVLHLATRKVDVIHFHSIGPSLMIWLARLLKPRTPVIATFHTQCYFHKKWGKAARIMLRFGEESLCRFSNQVITISRILKKYADEKHNIKSVYIPNGTSTPRIINAKEITRRWGLEKNKYVVYIGRLVRHKGIHHAIKAYKKLETDKKLVVVGDGFFTDDYVKELRELAENNDNIIFTGAQSGKIKDELFSNAYFFLQPSESEGLSIALLEAMAYGQAVLVSDIPENLEAIGNIGITFKNKDAKDLKNKMEYLFENKAVVEEQRKQGGRHVEKYYNWDNITKAVEEVYFQEIKNKKRKILFKNLTAVSR